MELSEFLTFVTRASYFLIAVIALVDFLRQRTATRLDIALMFLSLGITVLLQEFAARTDAESRLLSNVMTTGLVVQPYLLVRLVTHFRPVPRWLSWAALAGMLVSVAVIWLVAPLPVWAALAIVVYFVGAEGYAAVAFVQGAVVTRGVSRWRMALAATGAALVAAVIGLAGVSAVVPGLMAFIGPVTQAMAVLSGLAYYFGFAPPRWLRHTWQLQELYGFLRELAGRPAAERAHAVLPFLCDMATRAVGGRAALVMLLDAASQSLVVRAANHSAILIESLPVPNSGPMARVVHGGQPVIARNSREFSPEGARLAQAVGAEAQLVVPIVSGKRLWGLLLVLQQRSPLFPEDDVRLLELFAEQTAQALEQSQLVEEQRRLVEHLRERSQQLEAANKELEAFSYSVSHDLRAPLRHIEGFADLLIRDDTKANTQAYLERISQAATRMGRLIDDLLTFSRMGRTELNLRPVHLHSLVDDVVTELQVEQGDRVVEWRVDRLPDVYGDPELLRLVFANLLSNALKYTRPRSPACIAVGSQVGEHGETVIFVRDNGVGFDMAYADKLFGVFQRLHHSSEFEGVGIGLANVRRIVHRHGGQTWAKAEVDKGATFYIALPGRLEAAQQPAAASARGQED